MEDGEGSLLEKIQLNSRVRKSPGDVGTREGQNGRSNYLDLESPGPTVGRVGGGSARGS